MHHSLLALLAASSAYASPLVWKRQGPAASSTLTSASIATEAVSSLIASASSAVAPPAPSGPSAPAPPVPAPAPSVSGGPVPAPAPPVPSASASGSAYPGFPCPAGYDLSYVEEQQNYNVPLANLLSVTGDFNEATWLGWVSSENTGAVPGALRVVNIDGALQATEYLTDKTTNATTGAVQQNWNLTSGPLSVGTVSISNYTTELQVYTNDTETSASSPVSTVKIFTNACASDQAAGIAALSQYFTSALGNIPTLLASGSASSGASSAASSVASSAVVGPSSVVSSASSVLSSAVASATSAASSVVSSASSAVSSAAPQPSVAPGALQINTPPALVQCQPALITFSGGSGPYVLSVLPGGQAGAAALETFPQQQAAGQYTWNVNLPAGTSITLQVRDGTGLVNFSSPIDIQAGPDSSCLATASASAA